MRIRAMEPAAAAAEGNKLPFAMIRSLSSESLGQTPVEVHLDELLEDRFFSQDKEIRIFQSDGRLQAIVLEEDGGDLFQDREYKIENPEFGSCITVRTYMGFDEDGQAYWGHARPIRWKGAK